MEASSAWFAGRTWCFKEAVYNPGNSPRLFLCWLILVWFIVLLGPSNQRRDTSENKITRSSYSPPRKSFLNLIIWDLRASASYLSLLTSEVLLCVLEFIKNLNLKNDLVHFFGQYHQYIEHVLCYSPTIPKTGNNQILTNQRSDVPSGELQMARSTVNAAGFSITL